MNKQSNGDTLRVRAAPATQSSPQAVLSKAGIPIASHTPGPWRWEVNRNSKRVELCGGPPKQGFGRYDLTVLSFARYGMTGAAPVFWHWDDKRWVGKPQRADELAVSQDGREHHADWFALIDHPDARLIEAAPDLLEELRALVTAVCFADPPKMFNGVECHEARVPTAFIEGARAAIAKATAQGTEARSDKTACGLGPKGEGPVAESDAP